MKTLTYTSLQVRIGLCMNGQADIKELREILSSDTGVELNRMLLTEIDDQGFLRTHSGMRNYSRIAPPTCHNVLLCFLTDNQPISILRESDPLYCIELPLAKEPCEEDGAFLLLCWVNVLVEEHRQTRIGSCYTMQIARETSFEDLQKLLLKEMAAVVHYSVLCEAQKVRVAFIALIALESYAEIFSFFRPRSSRFVSWMVFAGSSIQTAQKTVPCI